MISSVFAVANDNNTLSSLQESLQQMQSHYKNSKLDSYLLAYALQRSSRSFVRRSLNSSQSVTIDAVARNDAEKLLVALQNLGFDHTGTSGRIVSGALPLHAIGLLEEVSELKFARENKVFHHVGAVTTVGDTTTFADVARLDFQVDGAGITVGVLSDSYNCLGGALTDKASGDLPQTARALEEIADCSTATDEGRALMQIIHDIAPGAELVFHTSGNGVANTIEGILELAMIADIIVDDFFFLSESFFQEDTLAQTIDRIGRAGIVYVTAAGNSGRNSYESAYNEYINPVLRLNAHDFDPGSEVDIYQQITLPEGGLLQMVLQWDQPFFSTNGPPGAQTDLDIFLTDASATEIIAVSATGNIGNDPVEILSYFNPPGSGVTQFNLLITKASGLSPGLIKYVISGRFEGFIDEYATHSSTIVGHANVANVLSVGASDPRLLIVEAFSSAGGTPILIDSQGQIIDLEDIKIRGKPDIVAPNNVNTTFFNNEDTDDDGFPNFLGTSASAPHVAGAAALIMSMKPQLQPVDVMHILETSATDIVSRKESNVDLPAGFDLDSGYGLINVQSALQLAVHTEPSGRRQDRDELLTDLPELNSLPQRGGSMAVFDFVVLIVVFLFKMQKPALYNVSRA